MRAVYLEKPIDDTLSAVQVVERPKPEVKSGDCLVKVHATAFNPSDLKAARGLMPHTVWPRVPGRDFSGVVESGPAEWLGQAVWGTGGDLGISCDGAQAEYVCVQADSLLHKPDTLTFAQAACLGVPFTTAYRALVTQAKVVRGERVLVMGANGQVGQAALQLAHYLGAEPIGVARVPVPEDMESVTWIDTCEGDPLLQLQERHQIEAVDVVLNTVGGPYFEWGEAILGKGGRHILMSSLPVDDDMTVSILDLYRSERQLLGVNTLCVDHVSAGRFLKQIASGFVTGQLRALCGSVRLFPLSDITEAYRACMLGGSRIVLTIV